MEGYFGLNYQGDSFHLFSIAHIISFSVIFIINLLVYLFQKRLTNKIYRYGLATLLILQEFSLHLWYVATGTWSLADSLPLHLCGVSIILSVILLLTKNRAIYEVVYFWGIGGALQALLTPDMGMYNFPHFRFYQFFISHGLIITSVLFMTFVYSYRPRVISIIRTFIITNLYMLVISGVNMVTGGNYLFVCRKPQSASLLDYLGPWPWYILALEGITMITFILLYLPFVVKDKMHANNYKVDQK